MKRGKQTVLVIEDQEINRKILRKILEPDYEVLEAENGLLALELLEKQPEIAAMLLDIVMPEMDGYSFLEAIKDSEFSSIPIIAVTAARDSNSEKKALDLGAWDFISKPYQPNILLLRLSNVITRSKYYLINESKHAYEHDGLTDCYNRMTFFAETEKMLKAYPKEKFALIRFDIDGFHLLNSFWGEEEGNRFLRFMADEVRLMCKDISPSIYGRINADAFSMCIPFDKELIDKLVLQEKENVQNYNQNYLIKPSFGIYLIEDKEEKVEIMYEWATLASRECKNTYDRYQSYYKSDMSSSVIQEQQLVYEMKDALDREEFEVYLQPKYNLDTESPYGAEALIRWNHPTKGLLSPGIFIPICERNGFIRKIDWYMWDKVCALLRRWIDEGKTPAPISVNVSRVNMYNPNLVKNLADLVNKYNISPKLLNLELTESVYMDDPVLMKKTVVELQQAGFIVLMDDFGSGYSSLNTLKDIPVDILKIDMDFLSESEDSGRNRCILAYVIRMAGWIGIPVIMEGVETEHQINFLRSVGCGYVQGYYFAKPMKISDYDALVENKAQVPKNSESENLDVIFEAVWTECYSIDLLFNSINEAAAIYEIADDNFRAIKINEAFHDTFGYGIQGEETKNLFWHHELSESEFKSLYDAFDSVGNTKQSLKHRFNMRIDAKKIKKFEVYLKYWGRNEKSPIIFAVFRQL